MNKDKLFQKIDFGTIGIKINDIIYFKENPEIWFKVGSGKGTPNNGGTLLIDNHDKGLISLRLATKNILGEGFNPDSDIFDLWTFRGTTLRDLYNE